MPHTIYMLRRLLYTCLADYICPTLYIWLGDYKCPTVYTCLPDFYMYVHASQTIYDDSYYTDDPYLAVYMTQTTYLAY